MGFTSTLLTTWEEFLQIPDAENGGHYELHDGEVFLVAPPNALSFFIETWLVHWLTAAAAGQGRAAQEFPYRPAANLQFWKADVAYSPDEDWKRLRGADYPIYSPPLIIEVFSPSNQPAQIDRQRIAAFSGGTREFWLVDSQARTVEVSIPGSASQTFADGETIPIRVLPGVSLQLHLLFSEIS